MKVVDFCLAGHSCVCLTDKGQIWAFERKKNKGFLQMLDQRIVSQMCTMMGYDVLLLTGTPLWTPETHSSFPKQTREVVKVLIRANTLDSKNRPFHPNSHLWKLPKEVLFTIIQYSVSIPAEVFRIKSNSILELSTSSLPEPIQHGGCDIKDIVGGNKYFMLLTAQGEILLYRNKGSEVGLPIRPPTLKGMVVKKFVAGDSYSIVFL